MTVEDQATSPAWAYCREAGPGKHEAVVADEMAAAALFLSSPAASFGYGSSFNVDGGSMFE
jgi:hypothetical protein